MRFSMGDTLDPAKTALLGARFLHAAKVASDAKTSMQAQAALREVALVLDDFPDEVKLARLLRQSASTAANFDKEQLLDLCRQAATQCLAIAQSLGAVAKSRIDAKTNTKKSTPPAKQSSSTVGESRDRMRVSRRRYWMCQRCQGVFEKEDLETKIQMYEGPRWVVIDGTRECGNCHAIYRVYDIYAGVHDVPDEFVSQLPGPADLDDESSSPNVTTSAPAVSWDTLRTELPRWSALVGLPLLGCLLVMGTWSLHESTGGHLATGMFLFIAGLVGPMLVVMGPSLFASLPRGWQHGATQLDYYLRYGVLLAGLVGALLVAFVVSYSMEQFALRWMVRIGSGFMVFVHAALLMEFEGERRNRSWRIDRDAKLLGALVFLMFAATFASDVLEDQGVRWLVRLGVWLVIGGYSALLVCRVRR